MIHSSITLEEAYNSVVKDLPFIRVYVNNDRVYDDQPDPDGIMQKYIDEHPNFIVTEIRLKVVEFHHYWVFSDGIEHYTSTAVKDQQRLYDQPGLSC
jgi:hypothetical protein